MEFRNEKPECEFAVPDKVTVRQQLAYISASSTADPERFLEKSWEAAKQIIVPQSWKCPVMELGTDIDSATDPQVTDVILWAGMKVREHMNGLEAVPKN